MKLSAADFLKSVFYSRLDGAWTVAAQFFIQGIEPLNQVCHLSAWISAASSRAEMGSAAKGTVGVNHAFAIFSQQGAGAVAAIWQFFTPAGAHSHSGKQRLPFCEHGGSACEVELAALGACRAGMIQRPALQLGVNGGDLLAIVGRFHNK